MRGDNPLFTESELLEMFMEAEMSPTRTEIFDFDLSATPPIFVLNTASIPEEKREEAEREYSTAVEMIRRYGESSTPVLLLEALVE